MDFLEDRRTPWLRPVGVLALSLGLAGAAVAPVAAQQGTPTPRIDLNGAPVALHDGSCARPVVEPEFEIGQLEPERYTEVYDDFVRDALDEDVPADVRVPGVSPRLIDEDLDNDGTLDEEEDLDEDGVLDAGIDRDADGDFDEGEAIDGDLDDDGTLDVDEENYLDEDLNDDGVLDADEDLDGDDVLDAGFDENEDGALDEAEVAPMAGVDADAAIVLIDLPTVYTAEEEVDATFEELFAEEEAREDEEEDDDALDNVGLIAVHESSENFGNIVACGELTAPAWEDESDVVIGIRPANGSGVYGFALFQRDTGNVPVFGENTTGVDVYLFQNLQTARVNRMAQGTPTPTPVPPTPTPSPVPSAVVTETEVVPAPTATAAARAGGAEVAEGVIDLGAPATKTVAAGEPLTLANNADAERTFVIEELGIEETVAPGDELEVTVDEPGTYGYAVLEDGQEVATDDLTVE